MRYRTMVPQEAGFSCGNKESTFSRCRASFPDMDYCSALGLASLSPGRLFLVPFSTKLFSASLFFSNLALVSILNAKENPVYKPFQSDG